MHLLFIPVLANSVDSSTDHGYTEMFTDLSGWMDTPKDVSLKLTPICNTKSSPNNVKLKNP